MAREVRSGKCKIAFPMDEGLRRDYRNVCRQVLNKSMNDDLRDHMQDTVRKFKKMIPEPEDTKPTKYIKVNEKKNPT